MKPRRTPRSNKVFRLVGGTEDNDLWVETTTHEGLPCITLHVHKGLEDEHPVVTSTWELTPEERELIAAGQNIELTVWGEGTPPVALCVTDEPLGKDGHG